MNEPLFVFKTKALYLKLEQMEIDKKEQEQLATEADLLPMQKFRLNVVFTLK